MSNPTPDYDAPPVVAIPSLIPEPQVVGHQVWSPNGSKDTHGNDEGTYAPAITRPAQCFYQAGTQQPVSPDYAARQVQELIVMVSNPGIYSKRDRVLVGGTGTVGQPYTGGRAFFMDGHAEDFSGGSPFPLETAGFGGQLHIKRVG
jgi:hypothetical protein